MSLSESTRSTRSPPRAHPNPAMHGFATCTNDRQAADCRALLIATLGKLEKIQEMLRGTAKAYFTVAETARQSGRSEYTVRRYVAEELVSAGRVVGRGFERQLLIPRDSLMSSVKGAVKSSSPPFDRGSRRSRSPIELDPPSNRHLTSGSILTISKLFL